jgi:hypothetical protein
LVGHFNSQIIPLIRKSGFLLCGVFEGMITSTRKPLEARKRAADFSAGFNFTLLSIKLLFIYGYTGKSNDIIKMLQHYNH